MKALPLLLVNTITFVLMLILNYVYGTGAKGERTVGEISELYPTLITPAGYAFSIWGIIYLLLLGFLIYQWVGYFKGSNEESLQPSGIWFTVSNIFNGLWIILWTNVAMEWSVLIICALLISLIQLVVRLRLEIWDAPLKIIFFVWWPIAVYVGWVVLATTLNISIWFQSTEWLENVFTPEIWSILVLAVATGIYVFLTFTRNLRESALVGVWGTCAIAANQLGQNETVVYASLTAAVILFVISGYHFLKNWKASPFGKIFHR
jgi:hypothetical protein